MNEIELKPYTEFNASEILPLYSSVGWTAYTDDPAALALGFRGSLFTLGAYDGERLVGLIRTVGDGHTVVLIQDILVLPEYQRRGIGTALIEAILDRFRTVRQIQLLTDDTEKTVAFYKSLGFSQAEELGVRAFMR